MCIIKNKESITAYKILEEMKKEGCDNNKTYNYLKQNTPKSLSKVFAN